LTQTLRLDDGAAAVPSDHMASKNFLAIFGKSFRPSDAPQQPVQRCGVTFDSDVDIVAISALDNSPMTNWHPASRDSRPGQDHRSKYAPSSRLALKTPAS